MTVPRSSALLLLVVAFVKFALIGLFVVPAWTNNDEPAHYSYALEFIHGNFMPVHGVDKIDDEARESQNGKPVRSRGNYVLSHPPLYYLMIAPFGAAASLFSNDPATILYSMRVATSLLGALGVMMVLLTARQLSLSEPAAWFAAGLALVTPNFGALAGGVSNDVGVFTFAAIGGYFLARHMAGRTAADELWCMIAFVAAALCKSTALPITVGIFGFFIMMRLIHRNLSVRWACATFAVALPLVLWHGYGLLQYGSVVRLGSLRTERVLSPEDFSFLDFITTSAVTDNFLASFLGHTWIRRAAENIVLIYVPKGSERTTYIAILGIMIAGACIALAANRAFAPRSKFWHLASATVALAAATAAGLMVAGRASATPLVSGGLTFLGIYAIAQTRTILSGGTAMVRFSLLTFAAFLLMCIVALYNIYQVQLIYGSARATHGRYFYSLAPLFAVALAAVLDLRWMRQFGLTIAFAAVLVCESAYWSHSALPIYRAYQTIIEHSREGL